MDKFKNLFENRNIKVGISFDPSKSEKKSLQDMSLTYTNNVLSGSEECVTNFLKNVIGWSNNQIKSETI